MVRLVYAQGIGAVTLRPRICNLCTGKQTLSQSMAFETCRWWQATASEEGVDAISDTWYGRCFCHLCHFGWIVCAKSPDALQKSHAAAAIDFMLLRSENEIVSTKTGDLNGLEDAAFGSGDG